MMPILGAILLLRGRTVTPCCPASVRWPLERWSDYPRTLSRAAWSPWPLVRMLAVLILKYIPPVQQAVIQSDDSAVRNGGKTGLGQ